MTETKPPFDLSAYTPGTPVWVMHRSGPRMLAFVQYVNSQRTGIKPFHPDQSTEVQEKVETRTYHTKTGRPYKKEKDGFEHTVLIPLDPEDVERIEEIKGCVTTRSMLVPNITHHLNRINATVYMIAGVTKEENEALTHVLGILSRILRMPKPPEVKPEEAESANGDIGPFIPTT